MSTSRTRKSNRAAAQTASIGHSDMMTFMPSPVSAAAEGSPGSGSPTSGIIAGGGGGAAPLPLNDDNGGLSSESDDNPLAAMGALTNNNIMNIPDPLRPPYMERGDSLDDEAFNASLDALLKEACVDVGESTQHSLSGIMGMGPPPPPPIPPPIVATTATATDNNAAAAGSKRKLPASYSTAPIIVGVAETPSASAMANSMAPPEPVVPAVALHPLQQHRLAVASHQPQHPSQHQQQAAQHQLNQAAAAQHQLNLNFSARGIVQLPPMFSSQPISVGTANNNNNNATTTFASAQPISVATTGGTFSATPISVATGSGGSVMGTTTAGANALSLLGTDYYAGGGSASAAAQQAQAQQARGQQPTRQQLPFQVASLGVPQHPQHGQMNISTTLQGMENRNNNAGDLSSSAASLMSQITLQPQHGQVQQAPQQQQAQPQPQQVQQQANELFPAFQLNSSQFNTWNAPSRRAATAVSLPQAHLTTTAVNPRAVSTAPAVAANVPQASVAASRAPAVTSIPRSSSNPPKKMSPAKSRVPAAAMSNRPQKRKRPPVPKGKFAAAAAASSTLPLPGVSEDESERLKRRSERNTREQERSHRITERIGELRQVLSSAGVAFKPDRYSTLVSVVEYIKQLQGKSVKLDEEHRKLLDTISGADRLVKSGGIAGSAAESSVSNAGVVKSGGIGITTSVHQTHLPMETTSSSNSSSSDTHSNTDEEFLTFVRGIDYKSIFARCGVALAIASVDGRFVDCNEEFLRITDYSRMELLGDDYDGTRRKSVLPHPQGSSGVSPGGGGTGRGKIVTISTTTSANSSAPTAAAHAVRAAKTPDLHTSSGINSIDTTADRPPPEITMRKHHHLSLFNLLGGEDMEAVYAAMSRMLRAPEPPAVSQVGSTPSRFMGMSRDHLLNISSGVSSSGVSGGKGLTTTDDGGGTSSSSSSDSCVKSDLTRSTEENSSSGNEVMNEGDMMGGVGDAEGVSSGGGDHWTGKVKHTRRKDHMLQLNISLVRTADGRPKFFNCALSEVE